MASSLLSFSKVVTECQEAQVQKIGRVRQAPASYYAYFFVWSTWTVFAKVFVLAYSFAFTLRDRASGRAWVLLAAQSACLLSLVPLNVAIHCRTFGRRRTTLVDGLLSAFVPVNFVSPDRERTTRFLARYGLAHHGVFLVITYLVFASSWSSFVFISLAYHVLFAGSLIFLVVFMHYGLDPLYAK